MTRLRVVTALSSASLATALLVSLLALSVAGYAVLKRKSVRG